MPRPILALIDPLAVAHNLGVVRRLCPHSRIWAVAKANAYGHGLMHIFDGLQAADGIAVLDFAEAQALRDAGWQKPILLLEGFFQSDDLPGLAALNLTPVIHNAEQVAMLEQSAADQVAGSNGLNSAFDVYLKLNSGMNRLGLMPAQFHAMHARLRALDPVREIVLMSHLANADVPDASCSPSVAQQLATFQQVTAGLPGARSLANSAAIIDHQLTHLDWVRPGIMLYGASPFAERSAAALGLRAAMQLHSKIIAVQNIGASNAIGYGSQYVASQAMRIGIVACGYADGYPRLAPNGTPVLVAGQRTKTLGRVSMDLLVVDLSHLPEANLGTPVELWGANLSVDEVAQAAGTVGYEMLCALAPRVPVRVI